MADQSTFERICEILREGELTPETTLEEAGLDSLAVVEAVMTCETEFDIEIDPDAKPATIGEFAEIVDGLIAEKN